MCSAQCGAIKNLISNTRIVTWYVNWYCDSSYYSLYIWRFIVVPDHNQRHAHRHTDTHTHTHSQFVRNQLLAKRLLDNTQLSQDTAIHASGGIRAPNPSNESSSELRLRSRGHWERRGYSIFGSTTCFFSDKSKNGRYFIFYLSTV